MIELSKVEIQDTPIKSILIMWWEGITLNSVEVPLSWAFGILLTEPTVSDETIISEQWQKSLITCVKNVPENWINEIKEDKEWSKQIASLDCKVEEYPIIFGA